MENINFRVKNLIKSLSAALQMVKVYTLSHRRAEQVVEELYEEFRRVFGLIEGSIKIGLVRDELFFRREIYFDLTVFVKDFIKVLRERHIEYLEFRPNLFKEELAEFLEKLAERKTEEEEDEDFFKKASSENISIGRFGTEIESEDAETDNDFYFGVKSGGVFYAESVERTRAVITDIIRGEKIDLKKLIEITSKIYSQMAVNEKALLALLSIKHFDDYTFVHSVNVAILSLFQAKYLGLSEEVIKEIGTAGLLHDIGKIYIKKNILDKKESLTGEEFSRVKNHALFGAKILLKNKPVDKIAFISALQHHLKFDLTGYPKLPFCRQQHLSAKIIAVSDVYDSLRSRRKYKEVTSLERVYEIMKKESGSLFDPYLVDLFFRNIGIWPAGTLVRLNTNEIGMVKRVNPQELFFPEIEILYDSSGRKLKKGIKADLKETDDQGGLKRRILRHLSPYGEGIKIIREVYQ